MKQTKFWLLATCLLCAPLGCDSEDDDGESEGTSETDDPTGGGDALCLDGAMISAYADPGCSPGADYYVPGGGTWPACATDNGDYPLIDTTPSSIARVEAYEDMMVAIRSGVTPTVEQFTTARTAYSTDEGLESRLQRREDLRFAEIPMADWDPGVDSDKQCSVAANVQKYPERCAGPATLAPMMNEAFMLAQTGQGDPDIMAARIDGVVLWFLYISTIKEGNTCFTGKAKDCDSSWAYYTGGTNRQGGIGLSGAVRAVDPAANDAVWDGFAAFRCLRDLEPADDDPSLDDLTAEGRMRFDNANVQLEAALAYAGARLVRARAEELASTCSEMSAAQWEFIRTFANALAPTGNATDPAAWGTAQAIIDNPTPTEDDLTTLVSTVDTLFPCP